MSKKIIFSHISKFEDKVITFPQKLGNQLLSDVVSYSRSMDTSKLVLRKGSIYIYITNYRRWRTLRVERRLRVFENRVLRRIFGPKRDEVTVEWRKLLKEELNDLYSLPNIVRLVKSRRMRWAGHVARMGEDRVVHRVHR
jgi:hypothetical protein